jgi:hypothetical protein
MLIDPIYILSKRMNKAGWKDNPGYSMAGIGIRIRQKSGKSVALVPILRIDPFKSIQEQIDKIFIALTKAITKNGIKSIFISGGGTIPIPKSFLDFCKEHGINIHIVTIENVDEYDDFDTILDF